jgi:large subunit ribosomal protein L13
MKTYATKQSDIKRSWHLIDAKDQVLGRLATRIAILLQGKNKPYFTAHLDCGDYVVVINSDQVALTGRKADQKIYYRHSGYPGGLKSVSFKQQLAKDSRKIIAQAVKNMLPKNKLRRQRQRRLKIFKTADHIYQDKFQSAK